MSDYGITPQGFRIKPFTAVLEEKTELARQMFGTDADLRSTSSLRKLLDLASYEDHELWKRMERLHFSNFLSTASGDALDLLGEDLGVGRRFEQSTGKVKFELSGEEAGRSYHLPLGTLVETAAPAVQFRTLALVTLSEAVKEAEVAVEALQRGPGGNVAAAAVDRINDFFAQSYLRFGAATVTVTNEEATTGGDVLEPDESYRASLLGRPRTLWTLESVRTTVKNVDGVRDCRLVDPAGGVDVSLSKFNLFGFGQRRFGSQRLLASPYRFDVLIATHPGFLWESGGGVIGVRERVDEALREVRPVSIFPNLRRANHVRVGLRTGVLVTAGHDGEAVLAALKEKLERRINALGLGRNVLASEVLTDIMSVAGVVDVIGLKLRRCPPLHNRVNFGRRSLFQAQEVELPVGENLRLEPDEIAEFKVDDELIEIEVGDR